MRFIFIYLSFFIISLPLKAQFFFFLQVFNTLGEVLKLCRVFTELITLNADKWTEREQLRSDELSQVRSIFHFLFVVCLFVCLFVCLSDSYGRKGLYPQDVSSVPIHQPQMDGQMGWLNSLWRKVLTGVLNR